MSTLTDRDDETFCAWMRGHTRPPRWKPPEQEPPPERPDSPHEWIFELACDIVRIQAKLAERNRAMQERLDATLKEKREHD